MNINNNNDKPFTFKEFSNLDSSTDIDYLVASMDRMFALEKIQAIKFRAINLLNLNIGDNVIEIGCGLGHDSEIIGGIVGSSGKVIAIDSSKTMLNEAKKRSTKPHVCYEYGIASNLHFPNDYFSAAYADRLLVSQKNTEQTIREIVRVVKKGGRICFTDIDAGSAVMSPNIDKLTNILLDQLRNIIQNPFIGRELHVLLKKSGVKVLHIIPEAYAVNSFELLTTMIDFPKMICDLHRAGQYTKKEAEYLSNRLKEAESKNEFLYSIILFTVVGEKE